MKGERFPIQMPFDDIVFQSEYHLPHKAWKWGLKVRKKDLSRVLALLEKEGLIPAVESRDIDQ